ncbi:MAG: IclR family transcriptional regulator [Acidobacteria bacterium]|nr:IclR family transcriptional regulator [Acidobacteriota bacterium]
MKNKDESSSAAVERTLAILEAVAQRDSGLTNSEISRKLEIPKSTASYLLRTLEQCGYLRREADSGQYRLGLKVLSLSRGVQIGRDIKEASLQVIKRLAERSGLTVHIAILDHGEMVYIEKAESPGFIQTSTWVGKRMQVNSTGVGKAMAAHLSTGELEAIVKEHGLKKRTVKTITTQAKFFSELEKVRERGYAVDDEENSMGARCVAAPIFDSFGKPIAGIGLSGTTSQINRAFLAKAAEMVQEAAKKISQNLNQQTTPGKDRG